MYLYNICSGADKLTAKLISDRSTFRSFRLEGVATNGPGNRCPSPDKLDPQTVPVRVGGGLGA